MPRATPPPSPAALQRVKALASLTAPVLMLGVTLPVVLAAWPCRFLPPSSIWHEAQIAVSNVWRGAAMGVAGRLREAVFADSDSRA